jgi:hypothetical protein
MARQAKPSSCSNRQMVPCEYRNPLRRTLTLLFQNLLNVQVASLGPRGRHALRVLTQVLLGPLEHLIQHVFLVHLTNCSRMIVRKRSAGEGKQPKSRGRWLSK